MRRGRFSGQLGCLFQLPFDCSGTLLADVFNIKIRMNLNVSERSVVSVNPECQCYALFNFFNFFVFLFVCLLFLVVGCC